MTPNLNELAIPLIDISSLTDTSASSSQRASASTKILCAFRDYGFLYLSSHPVSSSTLSTVFSESASFFDRPQAEKDALAWSTPRANRGYVTHGREKVSHGKTIEEVNKDRASGGEDLKESLEIGREGEEGCPNRWPGEGGKEGESEKRFREVMQAFFVECKTLHKVLMRAIAIGLGIEETFFDGYVRQGDNTLRLLHYPAVDSKVFRQNTGQVRAGAHTDYGSITLLFQDKRGGLQVQTDDGSWKDVTPIDGTIIVNAGDLLTRWSNDTIKSTTHRVVEPPLEDGSERAEKHPARYSIAYFCNPDFDRTIDVIPGTCSEAEKKYKGINSGEYLEMRLAATY